MAAGYLTYDVEISPGVTKKVTFWHSDTSSPTDGHIVHRAHENDPVALAVAAAGQAPGQQLSGGSLSFTPALDLDEVLDVTLTIDATAVAIGEVLNTANDVIANWGINVGGVATLETLQLFDEFNLAAAIELVFLDTNNSLGTANAAPTISIANQRKIVGRLPIQVSDYSPNAINGGKHAQLTNIGMKMKCDAAQSGLWVGAIARQAVDFGAVTDLKMKLGIKRHK